MEYLGGYCIKNQLAKMALEDLRRLFLTQALYKSELGVCIGQGVTETLSICLPLL